MSQVKLIYFSEEESKIDLCKKYWEINSEGKFSYTTAMLSGIFNISSPNLYKTVNNFCSAQSKEIKCIVCCQPYIFKSRSSFLQKYGGRSIEKDWECEKCTENKVLKQLELKRVADAKKKKIIKSQCSLSYRVPVGIDSFSFAEAVYFLSLIRLSASEDFSLINPLECLEDLWLSNRNLHESVLCNLIYKRILYIHPDSSVEAFTFEGNAINSYFFEKILLALPLLKEDSSDSAVVEQLEQRFLNKEWAKHWYLEAIPFWKEIALQECYQYLIFVLKKHGFSLALGEKTRVVLAQTLETFSVSQVYNFIWKSVANASAFYLRGSVSKKHASNIVPSSIQKLSERARVEGWEIKQYRRDRDCPQSMVSQVLYNTVLQIGNDGFDKPPNQKFINFLGFPNENVEF